MRTVHRLFVVGGIGPGFRWPVSCACCNSIKLLLLRVALCVRFGPGGLAAYLRHCTFAVPSAAAAGAAAAAPRVVAAGEEDAAGGVQLGGLCATEAVRV